MSEQLWIHDIQGFMTSNNYYLILPTQTMTLEEKLNACVRFFIYLGVILAFVRNDARYLFFGIVAFVLSVILYQHEQRDKSRVEAFLEKNNMDVLNEKLCVRSTVDNPFMNPSVYDIGANPTRPAACDVTNPKVQATIDKNFYAKMFRDVGDLYGTMASAREFYTVPSTTIPNDQGGFAEWLYGKGASCKEGDGDQCLRNIHFQRTIGGASASM
jgi:hypothetical protein